MRRGIEGSHHEMEEYAGGYIQARVGHIPAWLLAVYAVLFLWALYYGYPYWGGARAGTAVLVKQRQLRSTMSSSSLKMLNEPRKRWRK